MSKKSGNDNKNKKMLNYMSLGLSLGVLAGCLVAVIAGQNIGVCCSMGMGVGAVAGVAISLL